MLWMKLFWHPIIAMTYFILWNPACLSLVLAVPTKHYIIFNVTNPSLSSNYVTPISLQNGETNHLLSGSVFELVDSTPKQLVPVHLFNVSWKVSNRTQTKQCIEKIVSHSFMPHPMTKDSLATLVVQSPICSLESFLVDLFDRIPLVNFVIISPWNLKPIHRDFYGRWAIYLNAVVYNFLIEHINSSFPITMRTFHVATGRDTTPGGGGVGFSVSYAIITFSMAVTIAISLILVFTFFVFHNSQQRSQEQNTKRFLKNATKQVLEELPVKVLQLNDCELHQDFYNCAICLETFKQFENIRTLACKHVFHRNCIDPWLFEKRSCPICKLNILHACGVVYDESGDDDDEIIRRSGYNMMELSGRFPPIRPPSTGGTTAITAGQPTVDRPHPYCIPWSASTTRPHSHSSHGITANERLMYGLTGGLHRPRSDHPTTAANCGYGPPSSSPCSASEAGNFSFLRRIWNAVRYAPHSTNHSRRRQLQNRMVPLSRLRRGHAKTPRREELSTWSPIHRIRARHNNKNNTPSPTDKGCFKTKEKCLYYFRAPPTSGENNNANNAAEKNCCKEPRGVLPRNSIHSPAKRWQQCSGGGEPLGALKCVASEPDLIQSVVDNEPFDTLEFPLRRSDSDEKIDSTTGSSSFGVDGYNEVAGPLRVNVSTNKIVCHYHRSIVIGPSSSSSADSYKTHRNRRPHRKRTSSFVKNNKQSTGSISSTHSSVSHS